MQSLGKQILVEFYQCDHELLDDTQRVRDILIEATRLSGATIVEDTFHKFSPQGVSGVIVIAESHVAIHTWPEYGYAAVDIFTCGEAVDPWEIQKYAQEHFGAQMVYTMELKRGMMNSLQSMPAYPTPHVTKVT